MAYFINQAGTRIDVTIDDFEDYEVVSAAINTDNIEANIFNNILTSALTLTILTSDESVYTGSFIGKDITLKIGDETRYYTIVTNVADMSANYDKEEVQIEAVDDLTLLKNERYEVSAIKTTAEILSDILGDYYLLGGWGGTAIKDIALNLSALWQDDGQTAPTKYDVLKALCEYINRSVYYNYTEGRYILYAVNELTANGIDQDGNAVALTYHPIQSTINASAIAAADRRLSLNDPWQSAEIVADYNDDEINASKVTYDNTPDEGQVTTAAGDITKYVNYWGRSGDEKRYKGDVTIPMLPTAEEVDIPETYTAAQMMEDAKIRTEVASKVNNFGGFVLSHDSDKVDSTGDVEGVIDTKEYIVMYGAPESHGFGTYPSYVKKFKCSEIVTEDLYLILNGSVIFSRFPVLNDSGDIVDDDGNKHSSKMYRKIDVYLYRDGKQVGDKYECFPWLSNEETIIRYGTSYSIINNVHWHNQVNTTGYAFKLQKMTQQGSMLGVAFDEVRVALYQGFGSTHEYAGINQYWSFEFCTLDVALEHSTSVNKDLFDTSSVYKWVNDDNASVLCSGNESSESPTYVTYDGKQSGNNCAFVQTQAATPYNSSYGGVPVNVVAKYSFASSMVDNKHGGTSLSEERRLKDLEATYKDNQFVESVSVKGLHWWGESIADSYFGKTCTPLSLSLDLVANTTNITIQAI